MATSDDLFPTVQEQGARQQNVAAMQAAQVPLSSQGQGAPSPTVPASPSAAPQGGAGGGALPPPGSTDLSTYDVFQGREPPPAAPGSTPSAPGSMFQAQLATTQNQVMRDLFQHTSRFLEG